MLKKCMAGILTAAVAFCLLGPGGAVRAASAGSWLTSLGGSGSESFSSVCRTSDGGFIAAGYSNSTDFDGLHNRGADDAILARFDRGGKLKWIKDYGGGKNDTFKAVLQTSDGGFAVVGNSVSGDGSFPKNKGNVDAVLARFDSGGRLKWARDFGGSRFDDLIAFRQTSDGGFIAVGNSDSTNGDLNGLSRRGSVDAILVRFDKNGGVRWVRDFGGKKYDMLRSVLQTSDGGFAAAGNSDSADGDLKGLSHKGGSDAILARFDKSGKLEWVRNAGGSQSDDFSSLVQTSDGGFAAAGSSDSADGDLKGLSHKGGSDAILARFDKSGKLEWIRNAGGSQSDDFSSLVQTSDGGFAAAGSSDSADGDIAHSQGSYDAILARFGKSGKLEWVKDIGGSLAEQFFSVQQASDGGFVAAGYSRSIDGDFCVKMGAFDAVLVEYVPGTSLPKQAPVVDKKPPVIRVTNAKTGAVIPSGSYTSEHQVNLSVFDLHLASVSYYLNGSAGEYYEDESLIGTGLFMIKATDLLGNTAKFTVAVEKNPPVIRAKAGGKALGSGARVKTGVTVTVLHAAGKSATKNGKAFAWPAKGVFRPAGRYIVTAKDKYGCKGRFAFTISG